jgi:putative selenate reductase
MEKKARLARPAEVPVLPVAERGGFTEVLQSLPAEAARAEAARCLDCDEVCSLCVTVCPNRANHAYTVAPISLELPSFVVEEGRAVPAGTTTFSVTQGVQIVNLGDACNQCGNCVTFCPTSGAPWREKPTFWADAEGFAEAKGDAWRMTRVEGGVAIDARIGGRAHRLERHDGLAEYRSEALRVVLETGSWRVVDVRVVGSPAEGEVLDLSACARLVALLAAEPVLPPLQASIPDGAAV